MTLISNLIQILLVFLLLLLVYLFVCLAIVIILAKVPRNNIDEKPDWGSIKDERITTINGKNLDCWVVSPEGETENRPAIILLHGWGRNRGRMVSRARIYANHGFTTILLSVRDHGASSKERLGMSIIKFSEDLEACVNWWGKPVILCGHSIGGGATLLVGSRNPLVKAIIAEAPPISFPHDFKYVYRPGLRGLTGFFIPGITIVVLGIFRRFHNNDYSPIEVAKRISVPTLIIFGKKDEIFPYRFAELLKSNLPNGELWLPDQGDHYNIEDLPDYGSKTFAFLKKNGLV
jgi:pimeloyl-ACP methyl ester carboxylesterase